MPFVLAGVGVERDDRAEEEVVAATRAPHLLIPRRAVPRTDQELVELGIVGEAVPGVPAAADLPPLALPRLRRHLLRFVFEAVGGIAGHDEELPGELAGLGVPRAHVAARRAHLGAAVADEDLAAKRLRKAGDVFRLLQVSRLRGPELFPCLGIEGDEPPVVRGDDDFAFPIREAAARAPEDAEAVAGMLDRLRVVLPEDLAGLRVDGTRDAPRAGEVHHAVDDDRRGEKRPVLR